MPDLQKNTPWIIALIAAAFFIPGLGAVHLFDWDEINFAESAREMLVTGNYFQVQIDFQPFTEKPPFFFWLQALSMKIFGVNEFAARLPNAVTGIVVLLMLYHFGKKLVSYHFGLIWALSFFGSFLPHLYFKSGIIDPVFNLFMFLAIWHLYRATSNYQTGNIGFFHPISAGLFTGLAILTKGPVGFLVVFLSFFGFWGYRKFKPVANFSQIAVYALSTILVSSLWYGPETLQNGPVFIKEFIIRQIEIFTTSDAGHGQPFYYHFVVLLIGCFPISVMVLSDIFRKNKSENNHFGTFRIWMVSTLVVVLTIFSISTTKIVHYSSMAYYPLSFLAALELHKWIRSDVQVKKWIVLLGIAIGIILGAIMIVLGLIVRFKDKIIPYIKDPFAAANLDAQVYWGGWEWIVGAVFLFFTTLSWWWIYRGKIMPGIVSIFSVTALTVLLICIVFVPKIEAYSQGANIRFFKSLSGQKVYTGTVGYKSYAHLFYTNKPSDLYPVINFEELVQKDLGIPVYLSVKNIHRHIVEAHPEFELIREENGFVFYKRERFPENR